MSASSDALRQLGPLEQTGPPSNVSRTPLGTKKWVEGASPVAALPISLFPVCVSLGAIVRRLETARELLAMVRRSYFADLMSRRDERFSDLDGQRRAAGDGGKEQAEAGGRGGVDEGGAGGGED